MIYRSVSDPGIGVTFREALLTGQAADGGLFVPERMPRLPEAFLDSLAGRSLGEIGAEMLHPFLADIPRDDLDAILADAWNFPLPLTRLDGRIHLLELFHGPTLAFKDVGARFMARILSWYLERDALDVTILVATSGDTGSAVAHGFFGVPRVTVFVLYPSGKISPVQERQMTTLGGNITALEVAGTFDDCQRLVKGALNDPGIRARRTLTTANSINIGRLLPQAAYYGWAAAAFAAPGVPPRMIVPSGNFGNLTAAAYARAMGIPLAGLAAATNSNDVVPEYFRTGVYRPRASVPTASNAMDVGDPSNLARLTALYAGDLDRLAADIPADAVSDAETLDEIRRTFESTGTLLDPHTAVGVRSARRRVAAGDTVPLVVAATAHPAKFGDVVERATGRPVVLPPPLAAALERTPHSIRIAADFDAFREHLLHGA